MCVVCVCGVSVVCGICMSVIYGMFVVGGVCICSVSVCGMHL